MPKGPFGFNRPFGLGPLTEETLQDEDPQELYRDMQLRGHSLREWDPREFVYLVNEGVPKEDLRVEFRRIESGRLNPMIKKAHRMMIALDNDEFENFVSNNPGLADWVGAWALLEDQNRMGLVSTDIRS